MQVKVETRVGVEAFPDMTPIAKVLYEARQLLTNHWCQGLYADGRGNYCSVGGIYQSQGMMRNSMPRTICPDNVVTTEAYGFLSDYLYRQNPEQYPGLAIFNDTHTHEEVLALFDQAIASALEQGV